MARRVRTKTGMSTPRRMGSVLLEPWAGARVEVRREGMADATGALVEEGVGMGNADGLPRADTPRGPGRGVLQIKRIYRQRSAIKLVCRETKQERGKSSPRGLLQSRGLRGRADRGFGSSGRRGCAARGLPGCPDLADDARDGVGHVYAGEEVLLQIRVEAEERCGDGQTAEGR